jgi:starch phosphorylase
MKVLVNGGINLSELDGWWAEAYNPEVGWALGDGNEHGDDPSWDAIEAGQLYDLLEQKVVPEFYDRNKKGIPVKWIARMRESMAQLTPRFSADRTVREYTEQHYLPAASAYLERAASKGEKGKQIADLLSNLDQKWGSMHFGEVKFESVDQYNKIEAQIYFGDLIPDTLQLDLFANGIDGESPQVQKMTRGAKIEGSYNAYYYNASVSSRRPATDYTSRVIPNLPGVSVPLETNLILWQH